MSVAGRLWRRAPAFRALLVTALASTALLAMFPPRLPHLGHASPPADTGPHYAAPRPGAPLDYSTINMPPPGPGRSTLIPFAGRQVPLPAGRWTEAALVRAGGPAAMQALSLTRVQDGRLTGVLVAAGTSATAPVSLLRQSCIDVTGHAVHDLVPPGNTDPAVQECWAARHVTTAELRTKNSLDPLVAKSLDRLDKVGVTLPARLIILHYNRDSGDGLLSMRLLLPEPASNADAEVMARRSEAWMRRWLPLMHRGFDDTLKPADVTRELARDPAFQPGGS